ncbi:hypothetical protein DSLASN_20120 [Desulfoluna limicola]|uniref:Uncharacterized protein n=1 Tax=Desulfoluna limicola TaxID=2810562 RepID=A0ABM7PFL8_9BACT|nr:hypothetical protein DSLASN_20120 [Desulfoluna limicola]
MFLLRDDDSECELSRIINGLTPSPPVPEYKAPGVLVSGWLGANNVALGNDWFNKYNWNIYA